MREQTRNAPAILFEFRKRRTKKTLLRRDDGNIDRQKSQRQHQRHRPTKQRHGKARGHEHRSEIQRVPRVSVWASRRQFPILLHRSGSIAAKPQAGHDQHQAPRHGSRPRSMPPKLEDVKRGGKKAQRHADTARNALPARDPILARLIQMHRTLSGYRTLLGNRTLLGCRTLSGYRTLLAGTGNVKGMGFSPYVKAPGNVGALAPEGRSGFVSGHDFSRAENAAGQMKGTGFSPYVKAPGNAGALAPEGQSGFVSGHDFSRAENAAGQMKGTGFSPYVEALGNVGALAPDATPPEFPLIAPPLPASARRRRAARPRARWSAYRPPASSGASGLGGLRGCAAL